MPGVVPVPRLGKAIITVLLSGRVAACFGAEATSPPAANRPAPAVSFEMLRDRARAIAGKPYKPEPDKLPEFLKKLNYDDYQAILYRADQGPWQNEHLQFTFQFFHPGYLYHDPVLIHLVEQGQVREFDFSPQQFDYGTNHIKDPIPRDLHFAGFRALYPLNHPRKQDELASFIGASYFRVLGARQRYGASPLGSAVSMAKPRSEAP